MMKNHSYLTLPIGKSRRHRLDSDKKESRILTNNESRIWLVVLFVLVITMPTLAQNATVTFYSPGSAAKSVLKESFTFKGDAAFIGSIFDGDRKLAGITPNTFVTFLLPAGPHAFFAHSCTALHSFPDHPDPSSQSQMTLTNGEHYCVRVSEEYKSALTVAIKSKLESVPCDQANNEAPHAKPVAMKHVEKDMQSLLDKSTSFPASK
jgi:hypothetical protein